MPARLRADEDGMDLEVNGTTHPNATADDVARAIEARPSSVTWSITVTRDEANYLQAFAEGGEHYQLTCRHDGGQVDGKAPVRAVRARNVLTSYLNGDPGWREAMAWRRVAGNRDEAALVAAVWDEIKSRRAGTSTPLAPGELSPLTILGAMAVAALCLFAFFNLSRFEAELSHLPWPFDSFAGQAIALALLVPLGISFVVLQSKLGRIRRAAGWSSAAGRIVTSEMEAPPSQSTIANPNFDNLPHVVYQFDVAGQTFTGARISFGDDTGGPNAEGTLRRYPVGRAVTIYYDPTNPRESVLEREAPGFLAGGTLRIVGGVLAFAVLAAAAARTIPGWIATRWPGARNPNLATLTGLMGLALFAMVGAYWRRMSQAAGWPSVPGRVTFSGVRQRSPLSSEIGVRRARPVYSAHIEYAYEARGNAYVGQQLRLGMTVAGTHAAAEAIVGQYPEGHSVQVWYNPDNPTEAFIEPGKPLAVAPLALATGLTVFAAYLAGIY